MSGHMTEEDRLRAQVAGMPAPQALRHLAYLTRQGGSLARADAIGKVLETIADTMDASQTVVRGGLPVDSAPDGEHVVMREYAVRTVLWDGTEFLITYGDRLFSAVGDVAGRRRQLLQRDVVVGPWRPGPDVPRPAERRRAGRKGDEA